MIVDLILFIAVGVIAYRVWLLESRQESPVKDEPTDFGLEVIEMSEEREWEIEQEEKRKGNNF